MPGPDTGDVVRDVLALIEACHREDAEAVQVILDHGDCRLIACFAARVACDLIEDWLLEDEPGMFTRLRQHYS